MKLARKLTLALIFGILIVLAGNSAIRVRREIALFENDSRRDSLLIGRMLAGSVARIWPTVGWQQALELVEDANQRESTVRIRWIWLDVPPGQPGGPDVPPPRGDVGQPSDSPFVRVASDGEDPGALYTYVPVAVPGERVGAIEVRDSMLNQRLYIRRTLVQALIATSVLVTLCGGVAMGLGVALVGRPVSQLIAQARSIGRGDLSRRLELRQRDEIGELAREMNSMSELLDRANRTAAEEASARITAIEQLRHADRLSTVGRLAAGIAHELGTPLNVVMGRAQLILRAHSTERGTFDNATIIIEQARRMTAIIRQLLDFARRGESRKTLERIVTIARQTAGMLQSIAAKSAVSLLVDGDEALMADVDGGQIQQAITNLAMNGIQAMPTGGRLTISVTRRTTPGSPPDREGNYVCILIRDEGSGMPADVRERIFEPFFTTKESGEGTGLGLSVTYGIVQEHGGYIDVESEPGRGSCFSVFLPEHRA
ncbi:MAG TPA: HAMP domain-containing sensor histidine kinase [Vicinamibacteria bacterium]|nr:HAMP domain-containing sensor histidine kinase [Vicinamibacteria bacterium]